MQSASIPGCSDLLHPICGSPFAQKIEAGLRSRLFILDLLLFWERLLKAGREMLLLKYFFFFFSMLKWDFVFGTLPFFNYTNKFSAITFYWLNFQLLMTMWLGIIQFFVLFLEALVILLINAFYHKETRLCLSWNHVIRKHFSEVMLAFFKVYLYNSLFQPSLFFLLEHATSLFHTMYIFLDFFPSAPLTQFPYSSPTRHI